MSNETLFQSAVKAAQASLDTREIKQGKVRALLGDVAGNLVGPSGAPWVLARLYGDPSRRVEAYNGTPLTPTVNMPVELWVRYENGRATRYDVKGFDSGVTWAGYVPSQNGGLPLHAISHERGGGSPTGGWDAINVYERMFTSLRADAQVIPDLTVQVAPGYYNIDGNQYFFAGGNSPAMTPPGSGLRYDVVCIDATSTLSIEAGALTSPPVVFTFSTPGLIPLAAIQLLPSQTAITEADIIDVRPFLSISTGSGGAGQILADSNGDSLLDSNSNVILT